MILAVDDEQIHLDLVTEALASAGYEVKTFMSAVQALEFSVHADLQLIISDINMPEMDGFQFIRNISPGSLIATPLLFFFPPILTPKQSLRD